MQKFNLFFLFFLTGLALLPAQEANVVSVRFETDYSIRDSVDNIGSKYIFYSSQHPSVFTFVNNNGSITVCSSDEKAKITYIYEFSMDLKQQKTLNFPNEMDMLGAFTKDNEGNYYFFYGSRSTNKNSKNMAMVKYNPDGKKVNTYTLEAQAPKSFDGIRVPFDAGTCRLELSGSMLAVYFAREMFSGHQASFGFVLDKDSFARIDSGAATNDGKTGGVSEMPYTSHSFNQFILPAEGGFIFADHGDAYPRSFTFARFEKGKNTKRVHAFKFPGGIGANPTYAEMGGLAETSNGYIFTGAYGTDRNNPRNLFVINFDKEMGKCSSPLYLTKYTKENGHAGHPKIVALGSGRYLLLWELFAFSTQAANLIVQSSTDYASTFYTVIDENGKILKDIGTLGTIRLNMNDVLRYNKQNGKAYWAINDSSRSITLYALDIGG